MGKLCYEVQGNIPYENSTFISEHHTLEEAVTEMDRLNKEQPDKCINYYYVEVTRE